MGEDARSMFKVTRVQRLNGYSSGGVVYRLECRYDFRWIRQMPKRMEDFQNQVNYMSEQVKAVMRNNSASELIGSLALMGRGGRQPNGQHLSTRCLRLSTGARYRNV